MNLFSMILELPLVPLRGVVAVAGILRDQAERELYDPSQLRRKIEETDAAVEAGELTEEEAAREQEEILAPAAAPPAPEETAATTDGDAAVEEER